VSTVPDGGVVVVARPPLVYLVSILLGLVVNLVWPWEPFPRGVSPVGMVLTLLAVTLFVPAVREFRAARTPIRTRKPVTAVLTSGPYRLSRKPDLPLVHAVAARHRTVGIRSIPLPRSAAGLPRRLVLSRPGGSPTRPAQPVSFVPSNSQKTPSKSKRSFVGAPNGERRKTPRASSGDMALAKTRG